MLTQLACLSVEVDGRYAVAEELQFLKGYLQSLDRRVSAYEKIRAAEAEIIGQIEAKMQTLNPDLFHSASRQDLTDKCRRDNTNLLRHMTAALLFNEHDHLRENILLWHNTIAKSFRFNQTCKVACEVMSDVVKQYLTSEEAALFRPILELNHIILS